MCTRLQRKLCDSDICDICIDRSFSSHRRAVYWSEQNDISPRFVMKRSHAKRWFNCLCGHTFDAPPDKVVGSNQWCPYCATPPQKLCTDVNCMTCFDRSFASSDRVKFWGVRNTNQPRNVFKQSNGSYLFDCPCGHEFESNLANIYKQQWCPYCSNSSKKLCADDCVTCFNRSFASHPRVKFWDNLKNPPARSVFKSAGTKYWFTCEHGHNVDIALNKVVAGRWCKLCKYKTEGFVNDTLRDYGYDITTQITFPWCRGPISKKLLPFDFVIEEYKIIIELDGRQHFEQVSNWTSPEDNQTNDMHKMKCANAHGYTVIRLLQEDVLENRIDWIGRLEPYIYLHEMPTCVFISDGTEYECYKK